MITFHWYILYLQSLSCFNSEQNRPELNIYKKKKYFSYGKIMFLLINLNYQYINF
jgi:hypothetical protein